MDVLEHNRLAWNQEVANQGQWSSPVSAAEIEAARRGSWQIRLTPNAPVPHAWFPELSGTSVLCLAGAGGQQAPLLAAAGARVVVLDASDGQLSLDRSVAEQHGLTLHTVQGDMADLQAFADQSFDLVVNPCSNCFVPDLRPVWREAYRVLKPGGALLAGFLNPIYFMVDRERDERHGVLEVRHALPFSDLTSLDAAARQKKIDAKQALEFGHTLTQQIGWQLEAGFVLRAFHEDTWSDTATALNRYTPVYCVTRAVRP